MSAPKRAVAAQLAPPLLIGLSLGALALLLAFCVVSAAEVAIVPESGATLGDLAVQAVTAMAVDVSVLRGM